MTRLLPLVLLLACKTATEEPSDVPTADPVSFDEIHPIFEAKCGPCHVDGRNGGHNLGGPDADAAYDDSQVDRDGRSRGAFALERIQNGEMPPNTCTGDPSMDDSAVCLTADEQDLIQQWLDDGEAR